MLEILGSDSKDPLGKELVIRVGEPELCKALKLYCVFGGRCQPSQKVCKFQQLCGDASGGVREGDQFPFEEFGGKKRAWGKGFRWKEEAPLDIPF